MAQIKAFYLPRLVVSLLNYLPTYVQRRHRHQPDIEFERHCELGTHLLLEVIFVVCESAKILSIVPHSFAEFLCMIDLLITETTLTQRYLPRVIISL